MTPLFVEDQKFDPAILNESPLKKGEYENCQFVNCDFSNVDFGEYKFIDCIFSGCNLSMVKLSKTVFRDVKFAGCKMLGLSFQECSEYGLAFTLENCVLNHASFYRVKIRKANFKDTLFQESDFTEADLTGSVFERCDFTNATFDNTMLEKCDLRSSFGMVIDPERNYIRKSKFSLSALPGLLMKYDLEIS